MNAPTIVERSPFTDTTATSAQGHHTILTANRQADFLKSLQLFGNVRLACRSACVSAQTAYRARRRSPGFALAWDAALVAARAHAEATLADRAINGVEEAVYYHGEEVARRRRYDSRLLLAHLARLDRLEERAEVAGALGQLDDMIEALEQGADMDSVIQSNLPAEPVEVPECDVAVRHGKGEEERAQIVPQDRVPPVPSCRNEDGDLPPLEARLRAMEAARPDDARPLGHFDDPGEAEMAQLRGFEAGQALWWELSGGDAFEGSPEQSLAQDEMPNAHPSSCD